MPETETRSAVRVNSETGDHYRPEVQTMTTSVHHNKPQPTTSANHADIEHRKLTPSQMRRYSQQETTKHLQESLEPSTFNPIRARQRTQDSMMRERQSPAFQLQAPPRRCAAPLCHITTSCMYRSQDLEQTSLMEPSLRAMPPS